jgi:hypothetical protein
MLVPLSEPVRAALGHVNWMRVQGR